MVIVNEESFKMEIASYPEFIGTESFYMQWASTFVNNPNQNNPVEAPRPGLEPDLHFSGPHP